MTVTVHTPEAGSSGLRIKITLGAASDVAIFQAASPEFNVAIHPSTGNSARMEVCFSPPSDLTAMGGRWFPSNCLDETKPYAERFVAVEALKFTAIGGPAVVEFSS